MAKENINLKEYGNRKKRYKRRRKIIILIVLLAVVLVGILYVVALNNKSYKSYKVVKSIDIAGKNAAGYISGNELLIKYGKDGAAAYDKSGSQVWNSSFNMSDPIADRCGKYVVIADRGGTSIHIFNEKGETGSYSTEYDITMVRVASQGVVAALMQEGKNNYIRLFDQDGTKLIEFSRSVNIIGYPLDLSLSKDGNKMVLSCFTVSKDDIVCKIGCYNFSNVGGNYTNSYVGGFTSKEGNVAPRVIFLNNENFCVYKDDGFVIYSMKELPSEVKAVDLKGKILSVLHNESRIGVVLQPEDGSAKHLMLYDLKGKLVLDKQLDFDYKKISLTDREIIMYNDLNCIILRMNGKLKFKDTFQTAVSAFYPINGIDRYYMVSETKLSDIQLAD